MKNIFRKIGDVANKLREEQGLSIEQFASRANLKIVRVKKILNAELINMTTEDLFKICKALNIQPYEFFEICDL